MEMNRVDEDYEAKMVAFEVDCNDGKGEPMACHHVGEFYSVVKDQHDRSAAVYSQNCYGNKYGPSCFNLARLYLAGKGVVQNDAKAEELFGKACEVKHLQACHHQAVMLYSAINAENSTPQELEKKKLDALKLFEWSCQEGEFESCYHAASHYLNPDRSDRNPAQAIALLEKACQRNHAASCFNLAVMYRTGDTGVPKNPEMFEKYKAATNHLVKQYGSISGKKAA